MLFVTIETAALTELYSILDFIAIFAITIVTY